MRKWGVYMAKEYKNRPRDEAAEQIENYMVQHNLMPHDKLPSERKICEMWGFNRATLRSAIRKLIEEGRLYSKIGSGTYVAPPKAVRNLQDMQPMAEVAAQAGKELSSVVLYTDIVECTKQLSKKMQLMLGHKLFEMHRVRFMDGVPGVIEITYIDYERCVGIEKHDFSKESLYHVLDKEFGVKVQSGTQKVGITYTTKEEGELLQVAEGSPVFFISGIAKDTGGRIVECFKSVARPDQYQFSSELTRGKG